MFRLGGAGKDHALALSHLYCQQCYPLLCQAEQTGLSSTPDPRAVLVKSQENSNPQISLGPESGSSVGSYLSLQVF